MTATGTECHRCMRSLHQKVTDRPRHHLLDTSELALLCRAVLRLNPEMGLAPKVNMQEHEPEGATTDSITEKKSQISSQNRKEDTKRE